MKLKSLVFLIAFFAVGYFLLSMNSDDTQSNIKVKDYAKESVAKETTKSYASKPKDVQKETRTKTTTSGTYGIGSAEHANDLLGVDSNNNGVRDDVEEYVNDTYKNPLINEAAMAHAKIIQDYLIVDTSDKAVVKAFLEKTTVVEICFRYRLGYFDINNSFTQDRAIDNAVGDIIDMTKNTRERNIAYRSVSAAASGMSFRLPSDKRATCNALYE